MRVMKKAVDALKAVYGTQYTYGPISEVELDMSKAEVKFPSQANNFVIFLGNLRGLWL